MILVLDSSAAVELALRRKYSQNFAEHIKKADWVIAPDIYISEVTNVFWKYYQFHELPMDICQQALDYSVDLIDDFISSGDLFKESFSQACLMKHPVYDILFLVLARRHNASLLTLDKDLRKLAKKHSLKLLGLD